MDPAIIGGIGSVLGGLFGKGKKVKASDNSYGHVKGIMRAAETFGFNPLTLLGSVNAVGGTAADNTSFGQGIANAAMIWSDSLAARASEKAKLNQYQMQNDRLQERVTALTLRPPVPGIFGGAPYAADTGVSAPDTPVRNGGGSGPAGAPSDLPPLRDVSPADPRREVDNKPVSTTSGVMVVDNPYTGEIYVPTLDGDEPVDLLDLPAIIYGPPQIAYNKGNYMSYGGGRESRPNDKFWIDFYRPKTTRPKRRPYERMGVDGALPLRSVDQRYSF